MWGGSSDTNDLYVVTSMIRARDQLRALAHAHHVVGRAVWDLVRETSATFVLHAMGKRCRLPGQEQQQQRDWGPAEQVYLCVRVSRVLGSAMGDVEGRVAPTAGSLCYWVDDRALLNMEEGRGEGEADCWAMDGGYCSRPGCWYICDGVTGARIGRVAEDPVGFSGLCEAVNGKWLVRCGDQPVPGGGGDDDGTNREVVMLTVRLNVLIQQSVLEYGEVLFREGRGVTTTVTLPQYVSDLKFMPSRPDHLLMAVFRTRETAPSFLIIDVEGTHTSGTLRLLSVTHCLIDLTGFPSLSSVFAMRRNDGSVYFITELGPHSFEVEETTVTPNTSVMKKDLRGIGMCPSGIATTK
ncbi:hypothetical protein Pelo_3317 [Pelomyxa schiedti]|nr:hypothetical protein Pelo_3317 [Pelomyxa schiedti]